MPSEESMAITSASLSHVSASSRHKQLLCPRELKAFASFDLQVSDGSDLTRLHCGTQPASGSNKGRPGSQNTDSLVKEGVAVFFLVLILLRRGSPDTIADTINWFASNGRNPRLHNTVIVKKIFEAPEQLGAALRGERTSGPRV